MAYLSGHKALGWRPVQLSQRPQAALGTTAAPADAEPGLDLPAVLADQKARLERIETLHEETLKWRKWATYATIAGALFAAVRLTDIYLAVKRRKRGE